jgi:hypothetical protein
MTDETERQLTQRMDALEKAGKASQGESRDHFILIVLLYLLFFVFVLPG